MTTTAALTEMMTLACVQFLGAEPEAIWMLRGKNDEEIYDSAGGGDDRGDDRENLRQTELVTI